MQGGRKKKKNLPPLCSLEGMYSSVDSGPVGSVVVNKKPVREGGKRGITWSQLRLRRQNVAW